MYCNSELEILCGSYLGTDDEKRNEFMNESDSFKCELISVRKKWFRLKENLSRNKLKPDISAAEWLLKQIYGANNIAECPVITFTAKIAFITPVSNV